MAKKHEVIGVVTRPKKDDSFWLWAIGIFVGMVLLGQCAG